MPRRCEPARFFVGVEPDAGIVALRVELLSARGISRPTVNALINPLPETSEVRSWEFEEESAEFLQAGTERAKEAHAAMQRETCSDDATCAARTMKYALKALIVWNVNAFYRGASRPWRYCERTGARNGTDTPPFAREDAAAHAADAIGFCRGGIEAAGSGRMG